MKKKKPISLSPSEWKVMRVVWKLKTCAARDVYSVTTKKYGWTPATAKTILRRLVEKGHLSTQQIGNCYVYQPTASILDPLYKAADNLLENAIDGTIAPVMFHMIKKGKMSGEDIHELRALLDEFEKNQSSKE